MDYGFSKAKLPRGMSYPLKRSALDAALASAGVVDVANVAFRPSQKLDMPLLCEFLGESKRGSFAAGKFSLFLHPVPSTDRGVVEAQLLPLLPELTAWMSAIQKGSNVARGENRAFAIWRRGDKLIAQPG